MAQKLSNSLVYLFKNFQNVYFSLVLLTNILFKQHSEETMVKVQYTQMEKQVNKFVNAFGYVAIAFNVVCIDATKSTIIDSGWLKRFLIYPKDCFFILYYIFLYQTNIILVFSAMRMIPLRCKIMR